MVNVNKPVQTLLVQDNADVDKDFVWKEIVGRVTVSNSAKIIITPF
jgi:hypothetical protein